MFPYLDLAGFKLRAVNITPEAVDVVASKYPGFVEQALASRSSGINARLRKRYGNSPNIGNYLPLGQTPPELVPAGTSPPLVTLVGRPVLGSLQIGLQVLAGGALGTATFQWRPDPQTAYAGPLVTGAAVPLPGTGLSASFPAGTYASDNVYAAATPVPEAVLRWLVDMVTIDVWDRRGRDPEDPLLVTAKERYDQAVAELKEASDSQEGLFDLPVSEDLDSAVTTGGPLGYSEQSPYTWADIEACEASLEDATGRTR